MPTRSAICSTSCTRWDEKKIVGAGVSPAVCISACSTRSLITGIEPFRWLVEQQEFGTAGRERERRARALREAGDGLMPGNLERVEYAVRVRSPPQEERPRDSQDLIDGHAGPENCGPRPCAVRRRISTPARWSAIGWRRMWPSPPDRRTMPISVLMVVVLPAPLRPRKP